MVDLYSRLDGEWRMSNVESLIQHQRSLAPHPRSRDATWVVFHVKAEGWLAISNWGLFDSSCEGAEAVQMAVGLDLDQSRSGS